MGGKLSKSCKSNDDNLKKSKKGKKGKKGRSSNHRSGSSSSKHRSAESTNSRECTPRPNMERKGSISSLGDRVSGMQRYLTRMDSTTLRSKFTNHFRITSSIHQIEFAYDPDVSNHSSPALNFEHGLHFEARDFKFEEVLGKGGFGVVIQATRKATGKVYALKIQPIETMIRTCLTSTREKDKTLLHMERTVLAACRGFPFIVNLDYAFIEDKYAVLALECINGGTLAQLINKAPTRQLPVDVIQIYTAEIAMALHFMHDKGIIYRDLKPSNILLDSKTGHIKLTDFGLAGSIVKKSSHRSTAPSIMGQNGSPVDGDSDPSSHRSSDNITSDMTNGDHESDEEMSDDLNEPEVSNQEAHRFVDAEDDYDYKFIRRRTLCGTAGYRPPEQVLQRYVRYDNRQGYDERADWFALGSTAYTMIAGRRPFPSKAEVIRESTSKQPPTSKEIEDDLLPQIADVPENAQQKALGDAEFLGLMRTMRYSSRFKENRAMRNFVEGLLMRNPRERFMFKEITEHEFMEELEFESDKLLKREIPEWIMEILNSSEMRNPSTCHAQAPRRNKSSRKSTGSTNVKRKGDSLHDFIDELVANESLTKSKDDARDYSMKWNAKPSKENLNLFEHWDYISRDAIVLEREAGRKIEAKAAIRKSNEDRRMHRQSTGGQKGIH